jgi:hypothetical protein
VRTRAPARCIALLVLLLVAAGAGALAIDVAGGWSLSLGLPDLAGPAGSDFLPEYTSAANAMVVDVSGALLDTEPWTVTIHRADMAWDSSLSLSAKRTSDGVGAGSITGGLAFQTVTLVAQTLSQGTGNRSSIQLQLKLAGVSVTMGSRILDTQVVLTLLDT